MAAVSVPGVGGSAIEFTFPPVPLIPPPNFVSIEQAILGRSRQSRTPFSPL